MTVFASRKRGSELPGLLDDAGGMAEVEIGKYPDGLFELRRFNHSVLELMKSFPREIYPQINANHRRFS